MFGHVMEVGRRPRWCEAGVEDCHCEQRRDAARDPGRGVPYVVTKFSLVKLGKDVR